MYCLHRGFDIGYQETIKIRQVISVGTGNAYGFLGDCYFYIIVLLLIFSVGKLIRLKSLSQIVCTTSLVWMTLIFQKIYVQKEVYFSQINNTFGNLLVNAILLDFISFLLLVVLLLVQIITAFQQYYEQKTQNISVD